MALKNMQKLAMVTAYDAWMATMADEAVDIILVGDSLGMVVQGQSSTLPVTLDEMIYHTKMVSRASSNAFLVMDLPFLSYQTSVKDALRNAGRCLKETMAQMVKLEGGTRVLPQIKALSDSGIPIMGHLGLTPQSIHSIGSYVKQAKTKKEADLLINEALQVEKAGASMIVLENIPHDLAKIVTNELKIQTIGIGAGPSCDGQVQVFHDLLGLYPNFSPRHAVNFLKLGKKIQKAIRQYAEKVRMDELISE